MGLVHVSSSTQQRGKQSRDRKEKPSRGVSQKHKQQKPKAKAARPVREAAGLAARQAAGQAVEAVLRHGRAFDDVWSVITAGESFDRLPGRDRAFARLIAISVLRDTQALKTVLDAFLQKPLDVKNSALAPVLLVASAQILILKTPPHAAISLAVEHCRTRRATRRFDKLANAVLRRVSEHGSERFATLDRVRMMIPDWLWARWVETYGEEQTREMVTAMRAVPPLDLSLKSPLEAEAWAERLNGNVLPTGSIRLSGGGRIEELEGYDEGAWWIQDTAAALPVKLLGSVAGLSVLDMCAAPGGKTAALASAGAHVTALDQSEARLGRLRENLTRLGLQAEIVCADASVWKDDKAEGFDAVLVDAPCTATGTIRRHPDILHLKRESDVAQLADLQSVILQHAATLVKPGGVLVYCTCSLEPEEGEQQVKAFLEKQTEFAHEPLMSDKDDMLAPFLTAEGNLRTLPIHLPADVPELGGLDGFFAARFRRTAKV